MLRLKQIVFLNLQRLTIIIMLVLLLTAVLLQILILQDRERQNAAAVFHQVEQVLEENSAEAEAVKADYRNTCLLNAEAIAYAVQHNPDILGDTEEFRRLARLMEVDEIHIFDDTGCIFTGSHPEYFGYTFDTGEQIAYFRPMLEDKTLRLCQDITPNTAEQRLVQYSAVWSADGQFIVQVGMYPEAVQEVLEKISLSYVFSLLTGSPGVVLYAIDGENGQILGSSSGRDVGQHMSEIGFQKAEDVSAAMGKFRRGVHLSVRGVNSFCIFHEIDGTYIGYVVSQDQMYRSIPSYTLALLICLALIEGVIMVVIWRFTSRYIISSISRINLQLNAVAEGNLDERIEESSSLEFAELGSHINDMLRILLSSTDKMSFILNRTSMRIGVYEYNERMKSVRYTDHIPQILDLKGEELQKLTEDHRLFQAHIDQLRQEPVPGEENVYCLRGAQERFLRLEEKAQGSEHLGILVDVTGDVTTRRRIENERDRDPLTGLYNRSGLDRKMAEVFTEEADMRHGAVIMVDSDSLKEVNDLYGHPAGDLYLQRMAEVFSSIGSRQSLTARQSGDEFVIILYGYAAEEEVLRDLDRLHRIQQNTVLHLEDGVQIPVQFSVGYVLIRGRRDYRAMLSEADESMYAGKRRRKQALREAAEASDEEASAG